MAQYFRSRGGSVTAVDTKTQLSTLGSETAPGPLLVPAGATHIEMILSSVTADLAAAQDAGFLIRLEGPGLPNGPETMAIGALGVAVATGGHGSKDPQKVKVAIPVTPSNEILIFAEMLGEDVGTATVGVSLLFTTEAPADAGMMRTLTLEGDINAVNTRTQLTAQGSVTAPSRVVPAGMTKISKIIAHSAADGLAAGSSNMLLRLGGSAVLDGEQTIFFAGDCSQTVQTGADAAPSLGSSLILENLGIMVRPGDVINVEAEHLGVDVGDTTVVTTLVFSE